MLIIIIIYIINPIKIYFEANNILHKLNQINVENIHFLLYIL